MSYYKKKTDDCGLNWYKFKSPWHDSANVQEFLQVVTD